MAEAFDWRITRGVAERQQAEARLQELQSSSPMSAGLTKWGKWRPLSPTSSTSRSALR